MSDETRFDYVADRVMWLVGGAGIASLGKLDALDKAVVIVLVLIAAFGAALDLLDRRRFPTPPHGEEGR